MRKFLILTAGIVLLAASLFVCGCSKKIDYTEYVSEYRSDVFCGTNGEYSVFVSCSRREYPYVADGNVADIGDMFEVVLSAPDNTKTYSVNFTAGGKEYSAELSFDSVRLVHRWSQSIAAPEEREITFTFTVPDEPFTVSLIWEEAVNETYELLITQSSADSLTLLDTGEYSLGHDNFRILNADGAQQDFITYCAEIRYIGFTEPLPEGEYTLQFLLGGEVADEETFTVTAGNGS